MTETQFQISVSDLLGRVVMPPAEWTMFPGGGYVLTKRAAALLKAMGLHAGYPDLLIFHGGATFGLELKTPKGTLLASQLERHPLLIAAGMKIAVCRSIDDVLRALVDWGIPTRISKP